MHEYLASRLSPLWAATNLIARKILLPRAHVLGCPVISVGNIVAGGVGKTELVSLIAKRFQQSNKRVIVASRGYASIWENNGGVAEDFSTAYALRFPDEALVHLKKTPGIHVSVGSNRTRILERYWPEVSPDIVLLDDGFQHFALARDLDILVHDFRIKKPILRDFPSWFSKPNLLKVAFSDIPAKLKENNWVQAEYQVVGLRNSKEQTHPLPPKAIAFCGLANPYRFYESLEKEGVDLLAVRNFRDHHQYHVGEIQKLCELQKKFNGVPLLTTLKDFVKLGDFLGDQGGISGFQPYWVEISVRFLDGESLFWKKIDDVLAISTT